MKTEADKLYYHSHELFYKNPFGALPEGSPVAFRIAVRRDLTAKGAVLLLRYDGSGETAEVPLAWSALDRAFDIYEAVTEIRNYTGIVWYTFRVDLPDGALYYGNGDEELGGEGRVYERDAKPYRVTVYDGACRVPDWYGKGITYQIFPDRFARKGLPGAVPGGWRRTLHENWDDPLEWEPLPNGDIPNIDFFGGNIAGVIEKLDYLASLHVKTIYFNPIFFAASNHRYDTADFLSIDPFFGGEEEFRVLCEQAEARGMRVMLDGVFNHTGSDSVYFNKNGTFPSLGAYQSVESPYYSWYRFRSFPDDYEAWWGVKILPQVDEDNPAYRALILGKGGVVDKWGSFGVKGWRLDVADELPDDFIAAFNETVKARDPDAVVIGEVWEDASNKISYGKKRRYLYGGMLDGVMNYPFKNALLDYLSNGDAGRFARVMTAQFENYPPDALRAAMNVIGTHDTERIVNTLAFLGKAVPPTKKERSEYRLPPALRERALRLLRVAATIQMTFPGSPCIYYGDEVGLEGFEDPFNRRTYPWGREDAGPLSFYRAVTSLRSEYADFFSGLPVFLASEERGLLLYEYERAGGRLLVAANSGEEGIWVRRQTGGKSARELLTGRTVPCGGGVLAFRLEACAAAVYLIS